MLSEHLYLLIACVAVAVLAGNLIATVIVLRSDFYSSLQQALQLVLVWLIPVVGAACCMSFAAIHKRAIPKPGKRFPHPDTFGLAGGEANGL